MWGAAAKKAPPRKCRTAFGGPAGRRMKLSALVVQRRCRTEQEEEKGVRRESKRVSVRVWTRVAAVWKMSSGGGAAAVKTGRRREGGLGRGCGRRKGRGCGMKAMAFFCAGAGREALSVCGFYSLCAVCRKRKGV